MPNSGPPWVRQMEVVVVVENEPVPEQPATEYAIATYGVKSTSSDSYQSVKGVTCTADRIGVLRAVEISCDNYAVAQFKLVVKGVTIFEDKKLPESFTKEFPDLKLSEGQSAELFVKSDGSLTINAYCDFSYKEVG